MRKAFWIIIILVIAIGLVAAGVYWRKRQKNPSEEPVPAGGSLPATSGALTNATETPAETGGATSTITAAARGKVADYFVNAAGETVFIQPSGEVILASTTSAIVSSTKIANLLDARFSPAGAFILVKYGNAAAPDWSVYDVAKNSWKQLGIDALDADWAPTGATIGYIAERTSSAALTTLDVRAARLAPKTLATLAGEDLVARFAGASRIMVFERSSAEVPGSLWSYDLKNNAFSLVDDSVLGLDLNWVSEDAGLLLKSKRTTGAAELFLIDGGGREVQGFSFLTLPEKCAFRDKDHLICGIPKDAAGLRKRALPDDYRQLEFYTSDALYEINLASGAIDSVTLNAGANYDMTRVKVFGEDVYFVNRADELLYKIELPAPQGAT